MRRLLAITLFLLSSVPAAAATRDILHHDLRVRLAPEEARIEVRDVARFAPGQSGPQPLDLLLHEGLELRAARFGGEELPVERLPRWRPRDFFEQPDYAELGGWGRVAQRRISAPGSGWPDGEFELELDYAGAIYDSLRPPDVAYGRGFESTSGLIDARGAFLTSESFWVPWTGEGRFHFRLAVSLPLGWTSMSQGGRARHEVVEGRDVSVWETDAPQEQVYLVAGPYTIREREHGEVELYTYTYGDTPDELCQTYLDAAARYLDRYGKQIAPYGFSKWAMVENWWQTGFGMPSFTLLGDKVIRLPFIVDTSYGHEILHCWWGNGVYVDYEKGNWCEGLTAYGADYAYKLEESEAAARDYRRNALTGYLDFASSESRDFPLREFRERSDFGTQAIGYGKSMMVFHMLEQWLGKATFDRGLQEFYRRYEFRPAAWDDLALVFSEVAKEDLVPWFSQWVDRTGAARISIGDLSAAPDGYRLRLEQKGEPYELRVPVSWSDADGEHQMQVELDGPVADVHLPVALRAVAVDPDYHLFREVYREEVPASLSQVLGADSTLVVIGRDCEPDLRRALHQVAEEWAHNQDMRIVDEVDLDPASADGRSRFLLGPGSLVDRAFTASTAALGDAATELRADSVGRSLVACFRDPRDPQRATVVVLPTDPGSAAAIGRKIPHYSRYSWLVFEGETNTAKGSWTVLSSPLRRTLEVSP